MGAAYAFVVSRLQFEGDLNATLRQHAAVASLGYRLSEQTTLQLSAGAVLAGRLTAAGEDHDMQPGFLVSGQISQQWLDSGPAFVVTSFSLGYSAAGIESPANVEGSLSAADARISVLGGYSLTEWFSPFALARGFVGPVTWDDGDVERGGSDRNHYAVGAGMVLRLAQARLTLSGSALGERSVSAGASYNF